MLEYTDLDGKHRTVAIGATGGGVLYDVTVFQVRSQRNTDSSRVTYVVRTPTVVAWCSISVTVCFYESVIVQCKCLLHRLPGNVQRFLYTY